MKQKTSRQRIVLLSVIVSFLAICASGCDCPKRLEALQEQNQALTERVIELEDQLILADAAAAQTAAPVPAAPPAQTAEQMQAPAGETEYVVVKGDTLWGIAKRLLGKGSRYEEILALNPHVSKDQPLAIGTKLTLPAQ